jgi:shikimate dehydrogenase
VNTVLLEEGRVIGDNTDAPGFLADLHNLLDTQPGTNISQQHFALVLGAGGSARAVVYALLKTGWRVVIAARRLEQAQALAAGFQPSALSVQLKAIRLSRASLIACHELWSADMPLIVNTTPLGMSPRVDASPWPAQVPFPKNARVYDLVYNPGETALVRAAREAGLAAATGLGMLIEQAALSIERWTGQIAPREAMRQAVISLDGERS